MQTLDDLLMPEVGVRLAETRKEIERELAEWGALPEDVKRAQREISESRWEDLDKAIQEDGSESGNEEDDEGEGD